MRLLPAQEGHDEGLLADHFSLRAFDAPQNSAWANEIAKRLAAGHEVVFRDHLEPVDGRLFVQDSLVVVLAQAETEAKAGRVMTFISALR